MDQAVMLTWGEGRRSPKRRMHGSGLYAQEPIEEQVGPSEGSPPRPSGSLAGDVSRVDSAVPLGRREVHSSVKSGLLLNSTPSSDMGIDSAASIDTAVPPLCPPSVSRQVADSAVPLRSLSLVQKDRVDPDVPVSRHSQDRVASAVALSRSSHASSVRVACTCGMHAADPLIVSSLRDSAAH